MHLCTYFVFGTTFLFDEDLVSVRDVVVISKGYSTYGMSHVATALFSIASITHVMNSASVAIVGEAVSGCCATAVIRLGIDATEPAL